jgi:hypothetical protein
MCRKTMTVDNYGDLIDYSQQEPPSTSFVLLGLMGIIKIIEVEPLTKTNTPVPARSLHHNVGLCEPSCYV